MVSADEKLPRITVRLPKDDYEALEAEAAQKGTPLASYVRDLLQAHLLDHHLDERVEEKLEEFIESDRFDDLFFEKMSRFFEARKKG